MKESNKSQFLIITGSESTGKTMLAEQLALHYSGLWIPELARKYIEKLNRSYTYSDVEIIAKQQIEQFNNCLQNNESITIFDTGLIITKVWFDVVFKQCPEWLITAINDMPKVLHLLCATDLPWVADTVRENGGEMREKLNTIYSNELETFGFPYRIITGKGMARLNNAVEAVTAFNKNNL